MREEEKEVDETVSELSLDVADIDDEGAAEELLFAAMNGNEEPTDAIVEGDADEVGAARDEVDSSLLDELSSAVWKSADEVV